MTEPSENIKVFVRIRPYVSNCQKSIIVHSNQELSLLSNAYKFNTIFAENVQQDDAFNEILVPIVRDFIQGYNCTLFSYGASKVDLALNQTNSTTLPKCPQSNDDSMSALVSCAMYQLFEQLAQLDVSSCVRISYLEIVDEELFDLLQPNTAGSGAQLKIFENDKNQVYVNGLSKMTVHSAAEAMMIYRMAQKNAHSSKSYSILTISVQSKEKPTIQMEENEELFKFRKLYLVQLSQEMQKKQARGKTVQSSTSLSRVVQALISKQSYIPYRDSKLTRLMQESLGGNTKTAIVANVAADMNCIDETAQALELLNRMKAISNNPKVNERLEDARTLNEMVDEIIKLKLDIEANHNKTGHFVTDETYDSYKNELNNVRADSRQNKQELMRVNKEGTDLNSIISNVNSNLCAKNEIFTKVHSVSTIKQKHLQAISNVNNQRAELINRYSVNEESITDQATEIIANVKQAIVDKTHLDDCVERYKSSHDRAIEKVHSFQSNMEQKLDKLQLDSNKTRDKLAAKYDLISEMEKNFLRSSNALMELIKTRSIGMLDQLESVCRQESNANTDVKNNWNSYLLEHLNSAELNISIYKEFASKLEEQATIVETSHEMLKKLFESQANKDVATIANIKQMVGAHIENIVEEAHRMECMLGESTEINDNINDKMASIVEQMRTIMLQMEKNTAIIRNKIEPALLASKMNVVELQQSIVESFDGEKLVSSLDRARFETDDLKTKQQQLKAVGQRNAQLQNDLFEKVAMKNTSTMENSRVHIETVSANLPSKRDIISDSNDVRALTNELNMHQNRLSDANKENSDAIEHIAKSMQQMAGTATQKIVASQKQLKYFRETDFCEYQSAGDTPAKREYSTSVSLIGATPLDSIKQRFRERHSQINSPNSDAEFSFLLE